MLSGSYTGLQPIDDTTPATTYTFNDFGYPDQSFSVTDGLPVLGFNTLQFTNTPTPATPLNFETTTIANKGNVIFNTPPAAGSSAGVSGVVNIPTASTGLTSLTFNMPTSGDNTVSFLALPAGIPTALNGGTDEDVTNVTGAGVGAGTTLSLNGGPSDNTLNYDAGGLVATVTAGALPGEILITIPGAGTVDAINYQQVNITDTAPVAPVAGAALTINSIEDFQLVDARVGTFTFPLASLFPLGTILPAGLPASDFTAQIVWGDGTTSAGEITQDTSSPGVYDVTGTHTYTDPGTFPIGITINFASGSATGLVNGTPVTITPPVAPAAGTSATSTATANVSNASLAVSAFAITGVEGGTIPSAPIATFIDAGGASGSPDPATDFSANIAVINSSGATVISVAAASITQNGNSNSYTVTAPALSLAALDEGTYSVVVTVTKVVNATTVAAAGSSSLVVSDAPLTAGAPVALTPNSGIALSGVLVGTFTDGDTGSSATDFTAVIDWGDGSPNSLGTVISTGAGGYSVDGSHTYAKPGAYVTSIVVTDVGGSVVTLTGSATVTDLPVTGSTKSFTAVEGQSTGLFVLATFEDPNTLATVSDVQATLAIGGCSPRATVRRPPRASRSPSN